MDIHVITNFYAFYWLFYFLCVGSFYSLIFLSYNRSPEKGRFPALKSLRLPEFCTNKDGTRFILKEWSEYRELSLNNLFI